LSMGRNADAAHEQGSKQRRKGADQCGPDEELQLLKQLRTIRRPCAILPSRRREPAAASALPDGRPAR
jgi:hypothetical protein